MLTDRVERWRAAGELIEFRNRKIYVQRRDGELPLLLLLHGFPSSSYDWRGLLDAHRRSAALMFDCLGFGLSDKPPDHVYSLGWQADAAEELARRAGSPPTFLVAHDMGTSVATELMARAVRGDASIGFEGALLFNGSILIERASLTLAQKLLRSRFGPVFAVLSNERAFRAQFSRLFASSHPLARQEAEDQWSLIVHNGGRRIAHRTIHYLDERERLTERWHGAFRDWPGRLSLAWGLQDPVATTNVLEGLQELRPGVPVHELPDRLGTTHRSRTPAPWPQRSSSRCRADGTQSSVTAITAPGRLVCVEKASPLWRARQLSASRLLGRQRVGRERIEEPEWMFAGGDRRCYCR